MSGEVKTTSWWRQQAASVPLALLLIFIGAEASPLIPTFNRGLAAQLQNLADVPYILASIHSEVLQADIYQAAALTLLIVAMNGGSSVKEQLRAVAAQKSESIWWPLLRRTVCNLALGASIPMLLTVPQAYRAVHMAEWFDYNLAKLTPFITQHEHDEWLARWSDMNNGRDFRQLCSDLIASAATHHIVIKSY